MAYRFYAGCFGIAVSCLLLCGCNQSQGQAQVGTEQAAESVPPLRVKDSKPPRFAVDKTTHDFDRMDQEQIGSHVFEIRNEGEGELNMRIQHTTCGCTSVKLGDVEWDPKHPAPRTIVTVPPGGKMNFEMHWDTQDRSGEFKTNANVETNDPKQPVATFAVEGVIVPYVEVSQTQVRIETIQNQQETTSSMYVYSKKYDDLRITDYTSSNPLVTAEFSPADDFYLETVDATSGVKVQIKVLPGLPIGPFAASLTLNTSSQERPTVMIQVVGQVAGDVLLTPMENLDYGTVKVNEGSTKIIFVKVMSEESIDLKLRKVELFRADPTAEGDPIPVEPNFLNVSLKEFESTRNRWQLRAEVPRGAPGGKFKGVVELETTHETAKVVKIPVRFQVVK